MKIVARFALFYFAASCVVFVFFGYTAAKREVRRTEETAVSDLQGLGAGLRDGFVGLWTVAGASSAIELARASDVRRSDVNIRWLPGEMIPQSELTDGIRIRRRPGSLRLGFPILIEGVNKGTLEFSRPLPSKKDVLMAELKEEVPFALLLAAIAAAIAVAVGSAVIGRPLQRVVRQARRVGAGDLSQRLRATREDEIGDLKREIKAMCDQLEIARKRAEDESTARTETLEQLRHLDRLRTVGTLASSIAHELGTPLNVVLIRGQSLAEGELAPEETQDAGSAIVNQVEKMSRIVRQLMDFARARNAPKWSVSARWVAEQSSTLLHAMAKKHKVNLTVEVVDEVSVHGDGGQLEQALTNLIVNGIQAMPEGGELVVRVRSESAINPPDSSRTVDVATIEVIDRGIGLNHADLSTLSLPFYTTKPAGVGTGLGLSVARGIAEDHGGWISVRSTAGEGSTFSLHIPREP